MLVAVATNIVGYTNTKPEPAQIQVLANLRIQIWGNGTIYIFGLGLIYNGRIKTGATINTSTAESTNPGLEAMERYTHLDLGVTDHGY